MSKVLFVMLVCFRFALSVPPSPTSAVTDMLKAEFATMKNTIEVLSDQWEKWNTLFLTSLEPRITSTAVTLASIDSNIHNLQERAHVWDTFQLHVSAWNDQLAALDRKMDILNKGQELVLNLDGKINSILSMEYKMDNANKLLTNVYDVITNLDATVHTKKTQDILLNEFTTRGVLSSIKSVEKKLDRLLIANQNHLVRTKLSDEKPKFTLKCNTPRILEELLNDISSKVDVIFDSISSVAEDGDDTDYDSDYVEIPEGSGTDANINNQKKNKRLKKAIRRTALSCKQTNQVLDEILNRAMRIENTSLFILDKENTHFEKLSKVNPEYKLLDAIKSNSLELAKSVKPILQSYFNEQRSHFEGISEELSKKCCSFKPEKISYNVATQRTTENAVGNSFYPTTSTHEPLFTDDIFEVTTASSTLFENNEVTADESTSTQLFYNTFETIRNHQPTWTPITNQNKSSCEDLDSADKSGVYIFGNNLEAKNAELSFNKRYCEIREDGIWTVIQRRDNYFIQHNFNASWDNYKNGFGDLHKDFWMGNDFLSMLSNNYSLTLRIELEDFVNHTAWAEYSTFRVLPESDNYRLFVGGYKGNASDSFSSHNGSQFSTHDRVNDEAPECCPCAVSYGGGWWFNRCFESNLNGVYHRRPNSNDYFRGIIWEHWLGNYSLKKTVMMVKLKETTYSTKISSPSYSDVETIPYYEDP